MVSAIRLEEMCNLGKIFLFDFWEVRGWGTSVCKVGIDTSHKAFWSLEYQLVKEYFCT